MTACAATCKSPEQSTAGPSEVIIHTSAASSSNHGHGSPIPRTTLAGHGTLSPPHGTHCPSVRSPRFASDHATAPPFARATDRGGSKKKERGREVDHLDTHARGADRRTASICRRESRRLIGGEGGWLHCAAHFDRWGEWAVASALWTLNSDGASPRAVCRVSQRALLTFHGSCDVGPGVGRHRHRGGRVRRSGCARIPNDLPPGWMDNSPYPSMCT
jgi:hypothetical protein